MFSLFIIIVWIDALVLASVDTSHSSSRSAGSGSCYTSSSVASAMGSIEDVETKNALPDKSVLNKCGLLSDVLKNYSSKETPNQMRKSKELTKSYVQGFHIGMAIHSCALTIMTLFGSHFTKFISLVGFNAEDAEQENPQLFALVQQVAYHSNIRSNAQRTKVKVHILPTRDISAHVIGCSSDSYILGISKGCLELPKHELMAIIAHECSHIKHADSKRFLLINAFADSNERGLKCVRQQLRKHSSWAYFQMAETLVLLVQSLLLSMVRRRSEFAADMHAATLYGSPAVVQMLQRVESVYPKERRLGRTYDLSKMQNSYPANSNRF